MKSVSFILSFGSSCSTKTFNPRGIIRRTWVHALIGLACCVTASRAWAAGCVPAPPGLVSWWQAEGNGNDVLGTNNATLMNGAGFATGKVGQAFSFNGVNQYVSVPDSPSLRPANLTVEGWVNFSTLSGGSRCLFQKPYGVVDSDSFGVVYYAGQLIAAITRASGVGPVLSYNWTPAVGTWHHVAYTFNNASSTQVLFVDGIAVASSAVSGPIVYDTHPFLIGADIQKGALMFFLGGLLDEAALYNRALSAVEIAAIYSAGSAGKCPPGAAPSIIAQPVSQAVVAGSSVSLAVTAAGTLPLSYQWRFNGTNIAGATGNSLTLSNVQPIQAGGYSVRVTNAFGSILSSNALLTVIPPPCVTPPTGLVSWWQAEGNANDVLGTNNGTLVNGATFVPGKVGQALSFNGVNQYLSVPDSPALRPTNLTLEGWVNFSTLSGDPQSLFQKPYGVVDSDSFGVAYYAGQLYAAITRVSGVGPVLTYNWTAAVGTWHHIAYTFNNSSSTQVLFVDGIAVASGAVSGPIVYDTHPFLIGADIQEETPTLFLGGLLDEAALYNRALSAPEIAAIYSAGASGKCITSYPPVITLQPTDRTVVAGDSATFSVAAAGAQPISYQWRLNGVNINGATGSSFTLAHPQPADAGLYSAMLSNSAGTVLSSNALLTVNPSPPCVAPPSGLVSWWQAEGNASDVLGTNNGTLVNGGTFAPGKVGQAFSFNGVNQYVSVPDSPALRPTSLTVEGWVNFSTLSGDPRCLFEKPYGLVDSDSFGVAYYAGQLFAAITRASGVGTVISYNWTPAVGTWHHVAYAFNNASSTQVLFVDGIAVASSVVSGPIVYDTHPFLIGADIQKGAPMFFLGGLLDEAALYNRALSVEEIAAIYNAGSAGKCTSVVPPTPHGATATATMVNDFVVGVTITDGGYGYTNTPTVRIVGGGGNGAQAVAVVSNGVVIAINILDAGFGYTSTPDIYIAPPFIPQPTLGIAALSLLSFTNLTVGTNYQLQLFSSHTWSNLGVAFTAASSTFMQYVPGTAGPNGYRLATAPVPSQAYASAQMVNGFVVGATVASGGSGYGSSPAVSIVGGGGSNATATASVSGGVVIGITITSAGLGYTTVPTIVIAPPPANALWPIVTQAMELNLSDLSPYENYQMEFAPAAGGAWSDFGIPFTTTSTVNTQYINVSGSAGFFRIRYAP